MDFDFLNSRIFTFPVGLIRRHRHRTGVNYTVQPVITVVEVNVLIAAPCMYQFIVMSLLYKY